MTGKKIITIFLSIVVLIFGLVWFCQTRTVALGSQLPEEKWTGIEREKMQPTEPDGDVCYGDVPMEDVLYQLQILRVSRSKEVVLGTDACFRITLYKEDAWPTVLYIKSTGEVHLARDMQIDDWQYYKGAEALYLYLTNLSRTLPVVSK